MNTKSACNISPSRVFESTRMVYAKQKKESEWVFDIYFLSKGHIVCENHNIEPPESPEENPLFCHGPHKFIRCYIVLLDVENEKFSSFFFADRKIHLGSTNIYQKVKMWQRWAMNILWSSSSGWCVCAVDVSINSNYYYERLLKQQKIFAFP